jgi:hypothetical protein
VGFNPAPLVQGGIEVIYSSVAQLAALP